MTKLSKIYNRMNRINRLRSRIENRVNERTWYYRFEQRYLVRLPFIGVHIMLWRYDKIAKDSNKLRNMYSQLLTIEKKGTAS